MKEIKEKVEELKKNKKRISLKEKNISKTFDEIDNLYKQIDYVFKEKENEKELIFCLYFGSILKPIEIFNIKFFQSKENEDIKNVTKIILRNLISNQQIFESNLSKYNQNNFY